MNGRNETLAAAADLIGRVLLVSLFLIEGVAKLQAYGLATRYAEAFGVPALLLPGAIAVELGCGLLVLLGWHTRLAALALAVFCVAIAVIFHTKFGDRNQALHFSKDIALAGAFLVVAGRGAGRFALDGFLGRNKAPPDQDPSPG
jgi:putative oxidoreductase